MPYIKPDRRIDICINEGKLEVAGELNYCLTYKCKQYLKQHGESYNTYNEIIGALECCKLELYRRKIALYEDTKIKENDDVY